MPREIEIDEIRPILESRAQLVEVLPEPEFEEEHLAGAINIPLKEMTERLCGMYPAGLIETDDGATIRFDARGWALRPVGEGGWDTWDVAGGVRFETADRRYYWLTRSLAVWKGWFDAATGRATWRIYGPTGDGVLRGTGTPGKQEATRQRR